MILQAVEVTTAIMMGMPALVKEGMSWREVRLRAMHAAPVKLARRGRAAPAHARAARSKPRASAAPAHSRRLSARSRGPSR